MLDALAWIAVNMLNGLLGIIHVVTNPMTVFDLSDGLSRVRFIYYGGSTEFFFAVFDIFVIVLIAGLIHRPFLWGVVRALEGFANGMGRIMAWAGLFMVLQQVLIILLQRFFRVSDITISPFGYPFTATLGWYADELKLYNAAIVALCCGYTFVQGGHVRVDLVYAGIGHRAKRAVDMFGALVFMIPMMTLIWLYGWFYLWRHLVTPPVNATDALSLIERKAQILRWNVQTTSFSPSGFNGYFLFKILLIAFAAAMFVHAISFFYRCLLEFIEGPDAADRHLDRDTVPSLVPDGTLAHPS